MTPLEESGPIHDVSLEVTVELDRRSISIREILAFEEGSVIKMSRSAGENIDIYIGKKLVAFGEIVIIENTMGVRITDFLIDS